MTIIMVVTSGTLIRRFLSILLLFSLLSFAHGEIRESKDNIVDSRLHKSLDLLEENLGFDNIELPEGHAIASVNLSGCNLVITVIGPVTGKAAEYAKLIDGWRAKHRLTGDVLWSQEDDSASAQYRYIPGHIGLTDATTQLDLDDLRSVLLQVEPKTQIVFGEPAWVNNSVEMPATWTAPSGYRYWNISVPTHSLGIVYGSIAIPPILVILLFLWFFLIPVGTVACFLLANREGKRTDIPLLERRRRYGRIVMGGTFGVLGVHMIVLLSTIATRKMEPLSQLWFGERFTSVAIPFLMIGILVPVSLLPTQLRAERGLSGHSEEEEKLRSAQPSRPVTPQDKPEPKYWAPAILAVGLVGRFCLTPLGNKSEAVAIWNLIFLIAMAGATFSIVFTDRKNPLIEIDADMLARLDAQLRSVVEKVSEWMTMTPPKSRVLREALYGRFAAVFDQKGVGVTIGAMEELAPDEIDFLVAHELAHEKLGHNRRLRWLVTLPLFFLPVCIVPIFFGLKTSIVTPYAAVTPMIVPMVLILPFTVWLKKWKQKNDFAADRLAVEATGNPQAAISALRKITLNSTLPGVPDIDMFDHPTVNQRLQAISLLG